MSENGVCPNCGEALVLNDQPAVLCPWCRKLVTASEIVASSSKKGKELIAKNDLAKLLADACALD